MALTLARTLASSTTRASAIIVAAALSSTASAIEYNMPVGATEISAGNYELHMLIFWICCAIGVVVFGAMFYSIFAHTKAKGAEAATFHHSTGVEIAWTIAPFLILVAMAIPAAAMLVKMEDTSNPYMTIKVTGFQWGWEYEYLDHGVKFYSMLDRESNKARRFQSGIDPKTIPHYLRDVDNPMVIPTGKKVKFLTTSIDVIHSWWVPALGGKKDANPGAVNSMWANVLEGKEGRYDGKCAELCGKDHGFMPIVVEAVTEAEFKKWVLEQGGTWPEPAAEESTAAAAPVAATAN